MKREIHICMLSYILNATIGRNGGKKKMMTLVDDI